MNNEERILKWDLKYEQGLPSLTKPDPFFISAYQTFVSPSFPGAGLALDVAGGLGRHALWLATRNWRVTVVDVSTVAIGKLSQEAKKLNVNVDHFIGDAADYKFQPEHFDLIVLFYHLDRSLFPKIVLALKPGGFLICKMSLRWDLGGEVSEGNNNLLYRNQLPLLLPELRVLRHQERPVRDRGVVEFVGGKS